LEGLTGSLGARFILFIKPIFAAVFWDVARYEREYGAIPDRLQQTPCRQGNDLS